MLTKLLKYDLKNVFKFISVFYIITLVLSILTRVFINKSSPLIVFIIGRVLSGALISLFANILINCIMGMWIRSFVRGVYKDESYLTHTLPVKKSEIYLSKLFTSVIVAAASVAVILAAAFIGYYTDGRWRIFKQLLFSGNQATTFTVLTVFIVFLEFVNLIQCGFTGIILGHRQNSAKTGLSVLFGFLVVTASQIVVLIFTAVAALVSVDFKQLFTSKNPAVAQDVLWWLIPVYIAIITVTALINIKLLNKGVDIE